MSDAASWPTFIAAAIGAFGGGFANLLVAFYQEKQSNKDKNLIHLSKIKIKIEKIHSISSQTFRYINDLLYLKDGRPHIYTEKLLSISFDDELIEYEDDLAVIIRCSRGHNIDVFIEVQERYRSLLGLLSTLKEKRNYFNSIIMRNEKKYNKKLNIIETNMSDQDRIEADLLILDMSDIAYDIYKNIISIRCKLYSARNSHNDLIKLIYPSYNNLYIK